MGHFRRFGAVAWTGAAVLAVLACGCAHHQAAPRTPLQEVRLLQDRSRNNSLTDVQVDELCTWALDPHANWQLRLRALSALKKPSTPSQRAKAVRVMRAVLHDDSYVVRAFGIVGLQRMGDTDSVRLIEPLLNDPSYEVRRAARAALDKLSQGAR